MVRPGARWATATLLITLTTLALATACVRRATTSQDFGLPGGNPPQRAGRKAATSPDVRAILQQQTKGAFNPLVDDRRVQALQTRLRLAPQEVAARLELAGLYESYRLYDDALEHYTEILRLTRSAAEDPGALRDNGPLADQALLGLGRCARAWGHARQAIPLVETFLKEWPHASGAPSSWNELGLLYDELGDHTAAESALRKAVARDAESDRLHNNLGYNLLLQNKSEAAEGEFRRALLLNPKFATARNNLGVVLARRGNLQGALEQFQLAADPATAHNNLAVVLLETGEYEQSRKELVKALAIRRNFAPALQNFKLVQERLRERAELLKAGRLPLSAGRVGSALPEQPAGAQSKAPEERR